MKRVLFIIAFTALFISAAQAQNLSIGGRLGELRAKEWIGAKPTSDRAQLINFFHTSSAASVAQLAELEKLATKYPQLNVIVLAKEPAQTISGKIPSQRKYFVGIDDNARTFSSLEIDFVPFSILTDAKGRILWFGATPSAKIISDNLK